MATSERSTLGAATCESAERRLRRALAIKERTLGVHHPEFVPTLGTLAFVCRRTGNDGDARTLYQRALELLERQGLSEHPHAIALKANLATLDAPSGHHRRGNPAFASLRVVTASGAGLPARSNADTSRTLMLLHRVLLVPIVTAHGHVRAPRVRLTSREAA